MANTLTDFRERAEAAWEELETAVISVRIGTPTCGCAAGALATLEEIQNRLANSSVEARIIEVGCMGLCFAEPLVTIHNPSSGIPPVCYANITHDKVARLVEGFVLGDDPCLELALGTIEMNESEVPVIPELPRFEKEQRVLLRNCGYIDPLNMSHYLARGGYRAFELVLGTDPQRVVEEIEAAELRGRGGAGFPTAAKWRIVAQQSGPKYIICNADEGDPGAFMDRVLLESDPHSVVEGMLIAGYATGADRGIIYTRAEYPLVIERLRQVVDDARSLGLLGDNILGKDFSFDVEVAQGAGAFVCGEETGMIAALEGYRGMARPRPPYPALYGLNGHPTVVDNVKTLALVTRIMDWGAESFRAVGVPGNTGTVVFALAGRVEQIGLVEVPLGTTLREVIFEVGGGIPEGRAFKAVQIGGPAGGCLPADALDMSVDYDSLQDAGAIMGSGGMIVLDESNCMVETARFFLEFLCRESCGKCAMGRLGVKQLFLILEDLVKGTGNETDLMLLEELALDIGEGTLCHLCSSAARPVLTTLGHFREEYEAHVVQKRCPALVCKDLIAYWIVPEKCDKGCDHCVLTCPTEAIVTDEKTRKKKVLQDKCVKCGTCLDVCPPEYCAVIKVSPPDEVARLEAELGG